MKTMATERMPASQAASRSAAHRGEVGRGLDRAVGADALGDLGDALVEHLRLDDLLGEDVGSRLVADPQRIAKALGDEEEGAVALALEERVGGDRRPHLDRGDPLGRDRRSPAARPSSWRMPAMAASR